MSDAPKTRGSRRTIPLAPETVVALRAELDRQAFRRRDAGPAWRELDLVFDRGNGDFVTPTTLSESLGRAATRAGLPPLTTHGLRKTCVPILVSAGVHPKVIADRTGHAGMGVTMSAYARVSAPMQAAAAEALRAALASDEATAL